MTTGSATNEPIRMSAGSSGKKTMYSGLTVAL